MLKSYQFLYQQKNWLSWEHILYIIHASQEYTGQSSVSIPFEEFEWYSSANEQTVRRYLQWMSKKKTKTLGLSLYLSSKNHSLSLNAEHQTAGDICIENGSISIRDTTPCMCFNDSGAVRLQNMDAFWLLGNQTYAQPCSSVFVNQENFILDHKLFHAKEEAFFTVEPSVLNYASGNKKQLMKQIRIFPYSEEGFLSALHYAFSLSRKDMVYSVFFATAYPYQTPFAHRYLWYQFEPHHGYFYYVPDHFHQQFMKWAKEHHYDYCREEDNYLLDDALHNQYEIHQIEQAIDWIQSLIDNNMQEIRHYALSHPFHPDDRFHILLRNHHALFSLIVKGKTGTYDLPLNWGDIPPGAVKNAYICMNKINAYSSRFIPLTCIQFRNE